jgi:sigma-E factor negative regulatory protein RseC
MTEDVYEEGVVLEVNEDVALVALEDEGACEECHAKLLCKPRETGDAKTVEALNELGAAKGERVGVTARGGAVLAASFLLYGAPLLVLLGGIFWGMSLFADHPPVELYSFLLALGLVGVYYGAVWLYARSRPVRRAQMPRVTKRFLDEG